MLLDHLIKKCKMTRILPVNTTTVDYGPGQSSTVSILCRICYDGDRDEELITPCNCKGTVAFIHRACLETWLGESNTTTCELCHYVFKTERIPKFTSQKAIWYWCRHAPSSCTKGVRSDILACTIITPLAVVITYICLFSSEYYSQMKFQNVPAARWTSVSLLVMIVIMLTGYYLWTYTVIRMHARLWYSWWQRTCDVKYIPPSTVDLPATAEIDEAQLGAVSNSVHSIEIGEAGRDTKSTSFVRVQATKNTTEVDDKNFQKDKQDERFNSETQTDDVLGDFSEFTIVLHDYNDNTESK